MKKLSVLLLAAIASVSVSGCSLQDIFNGGGNSDPGKKEDVEVKSVYIKNHSASLYVGDTYQLNPKVLPEEANQAVTYESSDKNESVIVISDKGRIEAVGPGDAEVYIASVANPGRKTTFEVSVEERIINYTVSFNANGGSGIMADATTSGSEFEAPECAFTRTNYHFVSWLLFVDEDSVSYQPGQIIEDISSNITLIAEWEEDSVASYAVSFNGNGGEGAMEPQETTGSIFKAPTTCSFTKTDHELYKWALNSASGTQYNPGDTIRNISSNITLYVIWKHVDYTVSFNANGGTGTMIDQKTNGTSYVTPSCSFSKDGYVFDKWALGSASGTQYASNATINNISGNIVLYATWVEGQEDTYYKQCEGLSGSALQSKLLSINKPKSPSYDWERYEDADEALDDSTSILSIYTRHNIKKSNHCGNYAWDKWNREHIWTQSAFPKSASDNHNIFACEGQINGYRSNKPFAMGGNTVVVFGHTTGCKQTGSTFEPCDEAKGEVARSVMYGTVMYSYTMTQEIDSIYLALQWHIEHPITERDTRRNEIVYGNQGNRNPFVDHPEYACKIWGNTNDQTRAICNM